MEANAAAVLGGMDGAETVTETVEICAPRVATRLVEHAGNAASVVERPTGNQVCVAVFRGEHVGIAVCAFVAVSEQPVCGSAIHSVLVGVGEWSSCHVPPNGE